MNTDDERTPQATTPAVTHASRDKHTPQDTVGAYRLVRRVATTAACEVWEVEQGRSRKTYAAKVMLPAKRGDRHQARSLKHEATVGQQLQHASIIKMVETGIEDGLGYLIMEYYPAPNLKQWLRESEGAASPIAADIILHAAEALDAMHGAGWVHRDVKPDNFLVGEKGEAKLIDFSLAQRHHRWYRRFFGGKTMVQGTMSYMAPEQIRKQPQDGRSDIYSFGCLVYEMVSGKPPYSGENPQALLNKHLRSPVPSLSAVEPRVTEPFADVVKTMLAKDPKDRPATMRDVIESLCDVPILQNE